MHKLVYIVSVVELLFKTEAQCFNIAAAIETCYLFTETAIKNVYDRYGLDGKDAMRLIEKKDKERSEYYRHYTGRDWTDARNYNLCLDTSSMSYDKCVEIVKAYMAVLDK